MSHVRGQAFLVGILLASAACSAGDGVRSSATPPSGPVAIPGEDAVESTERAGLARVQVRVTAHMPSDFDDAQPERVFKGRGVVDHERDIAGVYFDVAKVPNSAGYFGHVDPTMSVVYEGSRFIVSFPELAHLLEDPTDWMSYELSDLSDPGLLDLGIGQLREIGLSDPRLATELLSQVGELQVRPARSEDLPSLSPFRATVDIASLAGSGSEMQPLFEELLALGVTSIDVDVDLDPEGRVGRVAYSLSYPPKAGSDPVKLSVDMQFPRYGVERGLHAPRGEAVVTADDFFAK